MSIRLNPQDIMSCIDVVKEMGVNTNGMSLAMCVKLAVSAVMQGLREQGVLPTRDGFEFTEMVTPFINQPRAKKGQFSYAVGEVSKGMLRAESVGKSFVGQPGHALTQASKGANDLYDELVRTKARHLVRVQELRFKREADPLNFGADEQMQLDEAETAINQIDGKLEELEPQL